MNKAQKQQLIDLNNNFYQKVAPHFSATRNSFWPGWQKLPLPNNNDKVLDVASGNMRFKKFLVTKTDQYQYLGIDNCVDLLTEKDLIKEQFLKIDILSQMLTEQDWTNQLPSQAWHYVFCCAFLHHIPTFTWRLIFLKSLASLVLPGGILAVNFWQFLSVPKIKSKIVSDLGHHDYILNWHQGVSSHRYCHHFTDKEITLIKTQMVDQDLTLIDEYQADGSNQLMNYYLIWRKN